MLHSRPSRPACAIGYIIKAESSGCWSFMKIPTSYRCILLIKCTNCCESAANPSFASLLSIGVRYKTACSRSESRSILDRPPPGTEQRRRATFEAIDAIMPRDCIRAAKYRELRRRGRGAMECTDQTSTSPGDGPYFANATARWHDFDGAI
jgi:hypothetical protein